MMGCLTSYGCVLTTVDVLRLEEHLCKKMGLILTSFYLDIVGSCEIAFEQFLQQRFLAGRI